VSAETHYWITLIVGLFIPALAGLGMLLWKGLRDDIDILREDIRSIREMMTTLAITRRNLSDDD